MEGEELNCLYQIFESSFYSWSPLISINDGLLSPQNCDISPYQNLDTAVTSPPPPLIQHLSGNLNSNSGAAQLQAVSNKRGRQKQKMKEKETWYKGPWTKSEDRKLRTLVKHYGYRKWAIIAKHMARRIGKQCRERWHNNLRPPISKSIVWSDEEEMMIIEGHERFGNRWSWIARLIPGRSENDIKNHWNATKRRQYSTKNIQRPKRLRGLYQSTILENYIKKKFFNTGSTSSAASASTTPRRARTRSRYSTTTAATPPRNNALIPTSATTSTPPAISESNALIAADRPLSVDDYDIDGVPYFTFEGAIDENVDLMQNLYVDNNGDAVVSEAAPLIGGADYAATAYLAAEMVDEEMNFLRSLFGGINGGI